MKCLLVTHAKSVQHIRASNVICCDRNKVFVYKQEIIKFMLTTIHNNMLCTKKTSKLVNNCTQLSTSNNYYFDSGGMAFSL